MPTLTARLTYVPLDGAIADHVRRHRVDPVYGHPVHEELAAGYGPCRHCLRPFREGEERRLLFTHEPFAGLGPLPQPGPVFVHAEGCGAPADPAVFPEELRGIPMVLDAFAADGMPAGRSQPSAHRVEGELARLLADPGIERVHVRNGEAGCFMFRVERAA